MPLAVTVQVPVSSKDPRAVVSECIALVRANATDLGGLKIRIHLTAMADPGILLQLAQRLPLMALGFEQVSSRKRTAGEFRAEYSPGRMCSFNGTLTDHFNASDALLLVEELLRGPAAAIRSTAFSMTASNLLWKGAPPGSTGWIDLSDFKAFQRKDRFSLSACVEWAGEDPKSPEVREILERVSRATGIAFDKEAIYRVRGKERWTESAAQAAMVGQICFDEALEEAADEIPAGLISRFTPRALPDEQAWSVRLEQRGAAASDRVDFVRLLKRAIKENWPEWKFRSSDGDAVVFARPQGQSEGLLTYYKTNPRLGKAFTVLLGIGSTETDARYHANIYRLERSTEAKSWIYNTVEEATAAVNESIAAVREIWPTFQSAARAYFEPWPKEVPEHIPQHGGLTAREAYDKVQFLARKQFADARLVRIFNRSRSLEARATLGPELSFDGRLPGNAAWWFHFYSPGQDISFEVTVPFAGRIQVLNHGEQYRNINARRHLTPVGDDWLDSDRVLALAEERGGRERRSSGKTWGLLTKLVWGHGQAYWAVNYLVTDERGRNDLILNLDAATGEPIGHIRGF